MNSVTQTAEAPTLYLVRTADESRPALGWAPDGRVVVEATEADLDADPRVVGYVHVVECDAAHPSAVAVEGECETSYVRVAPIEAESDALVSADEVREIREIAREAAEVGDAEQVLLCRRALGVELAHQRGSQLLCCWPEIGRESRRDWAERCEAAYRAVAVAVAVAAGDPDDLDPAWAPGDDLDIVTALRAACAVEREIGDDCGVWRSAAAWCDSLYGTRDLDMVERVARMSRAEARAECAVIGGETREAAERMTATELRAAYARGRRDFCDARLRGADLHGADLTGADLTGARLRGADLTGADLTGADLTGADLTGADLTGARLRGADLGYADLRGADLTDVDLTDAQCSGVLWPAGYRYAAVTADWHGERGRQLSALRYPDGETRYWCGCLAGTRAELVDYIDAGAAELRASRTRVLDVLDALLDEVTS